MHQVGLGSGASDIIDVLVRMTCAPGQDKIMVLPPTFELYKVCATLHGAGVQECVQELTPEGQFCLPMQQVRRRRCIPTIPGELIKSVPDLHCTVGRQPNQGNIHSFARKSNGFVGTFGSATADLRA